jgi:amino acid adenylation domain-containing protein
MRNSMVAGLTAAQREALLQAARRASLHRAGDGPTVIAKADRGSAIPLSFAQQRLWFLAQMDGGSEAYHLPVGFRLHGRLDERALRDALNALVARHETLRTTFAVEEGEPVQCIGSKDAGFALETHDLRGREDAAEELQYLSAQEASAQFDLCRGPLIRGRLIHLRDDEAVLLVTMHHIVSDGWSIAVLSSELGALYTQAPLPALPVQYADYAVWQRRWLSGDRLATQSAYWESRLKDAPALLELPTDRSRPAHQQYDGGQVAVALDEELTARLKALGQRCGATLFMTVLAGWALLLARLSGQQEVVVGTPTANRSRGEIEGLIGFFINTLALRLELPGNLRVEELLGHVKQRAVEAQEHQDLPFEQVVELIKPARNLSHTPVFQVMFAWQTYGAAVLDLGPHLSVGLEAPSYMTAKFDLTLELAEVGGRIVGGLRYATALFERETMERHAGYLREVLRGMTQAPQSVQQLRFLPASERQRLLVDWNATAADYPRERCIHELFEAQAARHAAAVAVVCKGQKLTYAALNARADRLAHRLIKLGVKPDERVVTLLERSIDLIVAQLAILKAGAAYVPLDPQAPAMRQAWIVEDCAASLIIANARTDLSFTPAAPVLRQGDGIEAAEAIAANPDRLDSSRRVAYVIYTSGSTGTPKGVLVPHRAVTRLVINNEYAVIGADDRVAFAANPAFDASTFELWAPLLNGGTVVVIDHDTVLTPEAFIRTLQEERINVLWLTVGLFNQLAEALEPVFAQFKVVITGGDVLEPRVMGRVWSQPGKRPERLLNAYGPTETTTFATTYRIGSSTGESASIPIGRPISNTRIYLLDAYGEPVPLGAVGELYIGGDGVALGYLNRPELTAEKFLVDPFVADPDARMYRTGDLARYLPDGNLVFLGRNDHQVKIRGFRIELGEIEGRLAEHPAVREAAVLALDEAGGKRLVAYVVADSDDQLAGTLHAHLAACVPEYMVPAAFVRLDAFPLTPNGKLDRRALPPPDDAAYARGAYEVPQGETETVLAAIWTEHLGIERISRNDNFFNLGGHSFLALRVISEINKRLKLHLNVPTFFMHPTIEQLTRDIEHRHHAHTKPRVMTLRAGHTGLPIYLMGARPEEFRLGQLIGGDRRIVTIDAPMQEAWLSAFETADTDALPTIEQLGALYGELLAAHVGSSPCVVAGYCWGGKIAFEAARVLQRAGGDVAFVLLLDTQALTSTSYTLGPALASFAWIWCGATTRQAGDGLSMHRLHASLRDSWTLLRWLLSRVPNSVKHRFNGIKTRLDKMTNRPAPAILPSGYFDEEGRPIDTLRINRLALRIGRLWRPQPLDAAGVLIRADNSEDMLPGTDPAGGWGGLFARGLEIIQTRGDHHSMMSDENATALAQQMDLILDRYEAARNERASVLGNQTDHGIADGHGRFDPAPSQPEQRVT